MSIRVEILTATWSRVVEEAEAVFLPGAECPFEVLPRHAAIISNLVEGTVRWREAGKEDSISIKCGVVRLKDDRMQICVEI